MSVHDLSCVQNICLECFGFKVEALSTDVVTSDDGDNAGIHLAVAEARLILFVNCGSKLEAL